MRPLLARLAFSSLPALLAACDVYDSSLLEGGANAGGGTGNTPTGGQGQGAGPVACETPEDCGANTECGARTCEDDLCGVDAEPEGTVTTEQTAGDCLQNECDGEGNIVGVIDDADVPTDTNDCTADVCTAGIPSNDPVAPGATCDQGGGQVCNEAGACVECIDGFNVERTRPSDRPDDQFVRDHHGRKLSGKPRVSPVSDPAYHSAPGNGQ